MHIARNAYSLMFLHLWIVSAARVTAAVPTYVHLCLACTHDLMLLRPALR